MRKRLSYLVWLSVGLGVGISMVIGIAFLVVWFKYATNLWERAEALWEGIESLIASILLATMAIGFLQADQLTKKWHRKLRKKLDINEPPPSVTAGFDKDAIDAVAANNEYDSDDDDASDGSSVRRQKFIRSMMPSFGRKKSELVVEEDTKDVEYVPKKTAGYTMFIVPFITVLREGLESMVFLGGIGISSDPGTIPLAAVCGFACGALVGIIMYRLGTTVHIRTFFLVASIFILFVSAGLLSTSIVKIQGYQFSTMLGGVDTEELVGIYDVPRTIFYLNCCEPESASNLGWQIFGAVLGWNNIGTYASVFTYIGFCLLVAVTLVIMKVIRLRKYQSKLMAKQFRREKEREGKEMKEVKMIEVGDVSSDAKEYPEFLVSTTSLQSQPQQFDSPGLPERL
ncbi:high-affinity iron permease [Blyttiomyces sp. JEL0837]|nr:high-affinity iron permease [Blyttiomyces sp. JEL0837]